MIYQNRSEDIICAVSTPQGLGGISVVRVCGKEALSKIHKAIPFLNEVESHRCYVGFLKNPLNDAPIDQVVVTYFSDKKSFTGQETIEISCHGSPVICNQILQVLIDLGCRPADRGEFTFRSFMNKKIDLIQAESILSLIESQSERSAKIALLQLEGELSKQILYIEDQITWVMAHIEAGIDFSTEGLDLTDKTEIFNRLQNCRNLLLALLKSYQAGRRIKDGLNVVLAGKPNAGKSSWMNLIAEKEKSIVTAIPGTTRDIIETDILFNGLKMVFLDTAGLRTDTLDEIEKIGITKSMQAILSADFVIYIVDSNQGIDEEDQKQILNIAPEKRIILFNKTDLLSSVDQEPLRKLAGQLGSQVIFSNVFAAHAREQVLKILESLMTELQLEDSSLLMLARHYELVLKSEELVSKSIQALKLETDIEFLTVDLKSALMQLQMIRGVHYDDQIMDRVFKEFCIGK